jgi:hypothetical protein
MMGRRRALGFTIAAVQPLLMRVDTPATVIPAAPSSLLATVTELLELFHQPSVDGVRDMLGVLMPGDWTFAYLTKLTRRMPGQPRILQGGDQHWPGDH